MNGEAPLFTNLPGILEADLRDANPWWRGERISTLPEYKRWIYNAVLRSLKQGLAPITVLRGPRQVGKTTLLSQIIQSVLDEGVPASRVFRVQFDELKSFRPLQEPILELSRWFSETIIGRTLNAATSDGGVVYIFLDEVQNLDDWAPQLKHLVDINRGLRILVTAVRRYELRLAATVLQEELLPTKWGLFCYAR